MASQAKVIIKGQNNIGNAVKSAASDLNSMKASADKLGNALKSAFKITAIVASIKKLGDTLSACFSEYETAERAYKQLSLTVSDDSAYKSLTNTIGALMKKTLASKGDVEAMVSELSALGKSAEEVDKISSAAVYLSNVTGKDLNSSMTTLLGTFNGTTTQLKKLGVDVSGLTKEELANGAAVDLVIEKFGELSDKMSEFSSSQSLKNIKDTVGDIRQGFGQIVSVGLRPMLDAVDTGLRSFQEGFQNVVDNVCIIITNIPEVSAKAFELIKGMFTSIFEWEGVKTLVSGLCEYLIKRFSLILTNISNLLHLFLEAIPGTIKTLWDGISNYGMYIITNLCNDIGLDLTGLINNIGSWLLESPIGTFVDTVVTGAVNGIRRIAALIRNIPAMFDIISGNISEIFSNIWNDMRNGFVTALGNMFSKLGDGVAAINLPQRIENLKVSIKNAFGSVGGWFTAIGTTAKDVFRYIGDIMKATFSWTTIKNAAIGMVETFVNFFIDKLNWVIEKVTGWLSFLGVETKQIERLNLTDGEDTNPYKDIKGITVAENSYVDVEAEEKSSAFAEKLKSLASTMFTLSSGQDSDWSGIAAQFEALLTPVFEEYSSESESIGQILATWTQKSSAEYLKASKESFSSIGDFLSSWASDFVADNKDGFSELISTLSTVGENLFGEDLEAFTSWMDNFLKTQRENITFRTVGANGTGTGNGTGNDGEDGEEESIFKPLSDTVKPLISSLGIFGDMILGMNPLIAILKPIIEGFVSVMAPALKVTIAPLMDALKWIGETLARVFVPILDMLYPVFQIVAKIVMDAVAPAFQMLAPVVEFAASMIEAMMPIITLVGKGLTILASPIQYVADLFSWLGKWLAYFGECIGTALYNITHPFNGRSMPTSPGGFSSDAFSGLEERLASWDSIAANPGIVSESVSTATSVSSAGYQGANQVTINIYQEAPVVGENGMKQFAQMIRREFLELDYYGVTT